MIGIEKAMRPPIHGTIHGRRCCSSRSHAGQKWVPISNFHVRRWWDYAQEHPRTLQSKCKVCQLVDVRIKRGHRPRSEIDPWFRKTHLPEYQQHVRERNRKSHAKRMKSARYRRRLNEDRRMARQAKKEIEAKMLLLLPDKSRYCPCGRKIRDYNRTGQCWICQQTKSKGRVKVER